MKTQGLPRTLATWLWGIKTPSLIAMMYGLTTRDGDIMNIQFSHKLKSTGQPCFKVPSMVTGHNPIPHGYERICLPFNRATKAGKLGEVMIVRDSAIEAASPARPRVG